MTSKSSETPLPFLSPEEEISLARRLRGGDMAAAQRLVLAHLRLVRRIARNYSGSGLPLVDLVQEGTIGLIQAVRKFDPDSGNRLSTYAMWWVRAAIQDHIVRSWSLVRIGTTNAQKALFLHLRKYIATHAGDSPAEDVMAALAARFNLPLTEVAALAARIARRDQSLDAPPGRAEDAITEIGDPAPSPEDAVAAVEEEKLHRRMLDYGLSALSPRERLVIHRRYLTEAKATFEAIGREIGVSKDRVRQLEAKALEKLRAMLLPAWQEEM